jgi:putative hydrolase of the HAD superfamily
LRNVELNSFFDEIIESAVINVRKTDPAIFELGVKASGLKPENTADAIIYDLKTLRKFYYEAIKND